MATKRLIPYSVYLSSEHYARLKKLAKERKASALIRDAVQMILDGDDAFKAGYNKAIRDAAQVVYDCQEAQMVAVQGRDIGSLLTERIANLEMK